MPKESESFNKNSKNSSQMMVIDLRPRVEEVLISDEEQTESDSQSYEAKLNEKLRDLDLYEEGMTIQQKEELIAVVVASWETAEKEKSRRKFYQEYMHAAEAFCNDEEVEFSFPETTERPNVPSVSTSLDISMSEETASVTVFRNAQARKMKQNMQPTVTDLASDSSNEAVETVAGCSKTYLNETFCARDAKSRGRRRGRSRRGRGGSFKQSHPGAVVTQLLDDEKNDSDTQELPIKHTNERTFEHSMELWKPCSSPKEKPLICSRRPWCNEENSPYVETEEDYTEQIIKLVQEFNFAQNESKLLWNNDKKITKPYYLTRKVHYTKKSAKPDKFDIMVGVSETPDSEQSPAEQGPVAKSFAKSEPFSRTAGGAFRYVKTNKNRLAVLHNELEVRTTRSGLRYDVQSSSSPSVLNELKSKTSDNLFRTLNSVSEGSGSSTQGETSQMVDSPPQLFSEVEVILDEKLPHFNHLRPDLCQDGPSVVSVHSDKGPKSSTSSRKGSSRPKKHPPNSSYAKHNHNVNSSCIDSDSSDCSSVIDVETIVDDEIEDFVLKRKMLPENQCLDKEANLTPSKRLKRGST